MLDQEIRWLTNEKYGGNKESEGLADDIKRLEAGEPVAYVIGFVDFLGARIDLSERPLIPRPETEFWLGEAIKELHKQESLKCLDIFSGSGCIGVAILQHLSSAMVTFVEKEPRFIWEIQKNLTLNAIDPSRYQIIQSDIFSNIKGTFDIILANPPYGAESRKANVQESVLKYEPHEAVFAPDDGLFYVKELISNSLNFLNKDGKLYFEFDDPQHEAVKKLAEASSFSKTEILKDQYGKWRWTRFTK